MQTTKPTTGQEVEVLTVGAISLYAEEADRCGSECFFYNFYSCHDMRLLIGGCRPSERKEGKQVVFKQLI